MVYLNAYLIAPHAQLGLPRADQARASILRGRALSGIAEHAVVMRHAVLNSSQSFCFLSRSIF